VLQIQLLPFPEIQTSRFSLRQLTNADGPSVLALRSDDRTMQHIGKEKLTTLAGAEAFINLITQALQDNTGITWGIYLQGQEQAIGNLGFWRIIKEHHRAELGYMLHPNFWRQGIMSETLAAILNFGFNQLQFHSVEANVSPQNTASIKLLEKHHFVREGYFRENYMLRGKLVDTATYSLLKAGFKY
jgi:[ribosomal protein S5]-alanine N-acetyltransferase